MPRSRHIAMAGLLFGAKAEEIWSKKRIPKGSEKRLFALEAGFQTLQSEIRQLEEENRFLRGLLEDRSSSSGG
jgi:hypothetical protein